MLTAVALAMRTAAMLFGAFISRSVGAEGVGLYTVIMTVYSFAVTFATSGISLTVTRLVAAAIGEGRAERVGSVVRSALIYSLFFGALATAMLFFGADLIGRAILDDARAALPLKVLAFSLVPISFGSVISGYFVGVKRVGFNAAAQVLGQMIKICVTVILVTHFSSRGTESSVLALCIGITLTEVIAFFMQALELAYDRYRYAKGMRSLHSELSDVAKNALPLAFSAYVRAALLSIEHILIPKRLREGGESAADAYAQYGILHGMALPLVLYPMTPLSSFSGMLVPEMAGDMSADNRARMERIASEAMNMTLVYCAVCAVVLFGFSEELGYAVYGSYEAGRYIATLAPVIPIMYLDHVTDSILKGVGEQVFSMWVNITDSIISVILVWFLIPRLGILGYAIVIVVMEAYNFILSFMRLRKRIKFTLSLGRCFALPLCATLLSLLISDSAFRFGGSTSDVGWLSAKVVFTVAVSVLFISASGAFITIFNDKKTEKSKV